MSRLRVARGTAAVVMLAVACTRSDAPKTTDSATDTTRAASIPTRLSSDWVPALGQFLVVPSDSENSAIVLLPAPRDDSVPVSALATMVSASGDTLRATLRRTDSLDCGDVPMVRLDGAGTPGTWAIGMVGRSAPLIHMDSIESLGSADSIRLAADIARLASALPMQQGSRFGGLPFSVAAAHRFAIERRQYLIAHLARRLNQEAQPLEERTLIIAERASAGDPFVVTYSQRSEGTEDSAEHFDVLAGLRDADTVMVLLARDQLSQTRYELLSRDAAGTWRVRWSRTLSC